MLAIVSAMGANVAFLCKHRGANAAPEVRFSHPLASAAALFRSRWWTIGWVIGAVAWGFGDPGADLVSHRAGLA